MITNPDALITHANDSQRSFGRRVSLDPRDKRFLATPPPAAEITRRYRYWATGPVLDQGQTPMCVAYSGEQLLLSGPVKNKLYKMPSDLYAECQANDEWPDDVPYEGTSVRALMKVLKLHGYIDTYEWAFDVDRTVRHLLEVGPVVFGITWYENMMETDAQGFVHATGNPAGGHAIMVKGANLDKRCPDGSKGAFRVINSWSRTWGDDGLFWLSFVDAAKLIADFGEVAIAKELKFVSEATG
jgi:hypothetical protein